MDIPHGSVMTEDCQVFVLQEQQDAVRRPLEGSIKIGPPDKPQKAPMIYMS